MKHINKVNEIKQLSRFIDDSKNELMLYGEEYSDLDFFIHLEIIRKRINNVNKQLSRENINILEMTENKPSVFSGLTEGVVELLKCLDKLSHLLPKEPCLIWDRIQVVRSRIKYIEKAHKKIY